MEENDLEKERLEETSVEEQKKSIKKSDIGIFVFLGIMALFTIAAVVFVIYVCSGAASGCNCAQCAK